MSAFSKGLRGPRQKKLPHRGDGFCPSCELKTCPTAIPSVWLLAIFRRKPCVAILLLVVGVAPTGNRDAGKFAADATQLPTGCQPESLAKLARRRSHKATLLTCRELTARTPKRSG